MLGEQLIFTCNYGELGINADLLIGYIVPLQSMASNQVAYLCNRNWRIKPFIKYQQKKMQHEKENYQFPDNPPCFGNSINGHS